MEYCKPDDHGMAHVVSFEFGRRCACGCKVLTLSDDGRVTLRDAPTRIRLSVMVLLLAAARKAPGARTLWKTRLFC